MKRDARIAILAPDGFEQCELQGPLDGLVSAGFKVEVGSLARGLIPEWKGKDWGDMVDQLSPA